MSAAVVDELRRREDDEVLYSSRGEVSLAAKKFAWSKAYSLLASACSKV